MPWDRRQGTNPKYRTPQHARARARLIAAHHDGDPCCLCGHPMHGPTRHLHADHDPDQPDQYRGLAHGTQPCQTCGRRCNVQDGAARGRARQSNPEPTRTITSRKW